MYIQATGYLIEIYISLSINKSINLRTNFFILVGRIIFDIYIFFSISR